MEILYDQVAPDIASILLIEKARQSDHIWPEEIDHIEVAVFFRNEMNLSITKIQEDYALKENSLKQKETELKQQQADIELMVAQKLKTETEKAAKNIKSQFEQQYEQQIKTLSDETVAAKKEISDLQDSYVREKRAMERIWKEREKQLEKVLLNTNHFIGSIKRIAGTSIPLL